MAELCARSEPEPGLHGAGWSLVRCGCWVRHKKKERLFAHIPQAVIGSWGGVVRGGTTQKARRHRGKIEGQGFCLQTREGGQRTPPLGKISGELRRGDNRDVGRRVIGHISALCGVNGLKRQRSFLALFPFRDRAVAESDQRTQSEHERHHEADFEQGKPGLSD